MQNAIPKSKTYSISRSTKKISARQEKKSPATETTKQLVIQIIQPRMFFQHQEMFIKNVLLSWTIKTLAERGQNMLSIKWSIEGMKLWAKIEIYMDNWG